MRNTLALIALSGLIVVAFVIGANFTKPSSCGAACQKQILTVSPAEFSKQTSEESVTIIDVRRPDEYVAGHIEGSINADISSVSEFNHFLDTLDKNGKYLVYCRSGNRSTQAIGLMEEKGFLNITNLSGGILAWQTANLPLVH